jgi:hypothetical protein
MSITPGPWSLQSFGDGWAIMCDGLRIAYVCQSGHGPGPHTHADGMLIAAAPDLLEACRLLLKYDGGDQEAELELMFDYAAAVNAARAAIAKATRA